MKIVMLNGQNHRGSSYHIGRAIIDRIAGEKEVRAFFFPKDLDHFCLGCCCPPAWARWRGRSRSCSPPANTTR